MNPILVAAIGLAALARFPLPRTALPEGAAAAPPEASSPATEKSPLACDRESLTPAQRKRHFDELGPALRTMKKAVRELPDGFEFEFPADPKSFQLVAEWVAGERVCCPFFDIGLRLEREGGPLWLRLTGRDGVKQFIEVEGASWLSR